MQIGKGIVRRSGKDVCLLAYGSSVNDAMVAAQMLEKDGVSATVIDARFCKPLDTVRGKGHGGGDGAGEGTSGRGL